MWYYDDARAAVRDALRLSRAMTFKSAVAGLPLGGGKGLIMAPDPASPARRGLRADALRDFGETVQSLDGSYITAEDVGTAARDMEVIASATAHVTGLSRQRGDRAIRARGPHWASRPRSASAASASSDRRRWRNARSRWRALATSVAGSPRCVPRTEHGCS